MNERKFDEVKKKKVGLSGCGSGAARAGSFASFFFLLPRRGEYFVRYLGNPFNRQ